MWRKLLLVVLLFGIGYLIWRRMQSSSGTIPTLPLTSPASQPPTSATSPSTPATGAGPRPVVTRIHRGEPPKSTPTSASGTTGSGARPVVTRVHRGAPPEPRGPTTVRNGTSATPAASPSETAETGAQPMQPAAEQETAVPMVSAPEAAPITSETTVAAASTAEAEVSAMTVEVAERRAEETATLTAATTPEASSDEEIVTAALATVETTPLEPIDINRADREALIALPGIGPVLADRIIAYREAHGPFKSVDDLIAIAGIGERNINMFRKLVYVTHD